jgi:two-component system KDP operon response regulator KdpE
MDATILVIEDDKELLQFLYTALSKDAYRVLSARDGIEGVRICEEQHPDLILLDLMLPCMDGWETCWRIRDCSDVPIIMLTALDSERDIVRGLELGADDYVVKPFKLSELRARIKAVLRRYRHSLTEDALIQVDDRLAIDQARACLVVDGQAVELSPLEYRLLRCFLDNAGRILTHQSLLTQVWGWEFVDETQYLKVYVCQLRKKIEEDPQTPHYIHTERGLGYRFEPSLG